MMITGIFHKTKCQLCSLKGDENVVIFKTYHLFSEVKQMTRWPENSHMAEFDKTSKITDVDIKTCLWEFTISLNDNDEQ